MDVFSQPVLIERYKTYCNVSVLCFPYLRSCFGSYFPFGLPYFPFLLWSSWIMMVAPTWLCRTGPCKTVWKQVDLPCHVEPGILHLTTPKGCRQRTTKMQPAKGKQGSPQREHRSQNRTIHKKSQKRTGFDICLFFMSAIKIGWEYLHWIDLGANSAHGGGHFQNPSHRSFLSLQTSSCLRPQETSNNTK